MVDFLMRRPRRNMVYSSRATHQSDVPSTNTKSHTPSVLSANSDSQIPSATQSDNLGEDCEINVMIDFVLNSGTKRLNMAPLKIRLNSSSTLYDESVKKNIIILFRFSSQCGARIDTATCCFPMRSEN